MNRAELIVAMAEKAGLTQKDAEKALKAFTEVVAAELKEGGKLGDLAPTILQLLGLPIPEEMTGESLLG